MNEIIKECLSQFLHVVVERAKSLLQYGSVVGLFQVLVFVLKSFGYLQTFYTHSLGSVGRTSSEKNVKLGMVATSNKHNTPL